MTSVLVGLFENYAGWPTVRTPQLQHLFFWEHHERILDNLSFTFSVPLHILVWYILLLCVHSLLKVFLSYCPYFIRRNRASTPCSESLPGPRVPLLLSPTNRHSLGSGDPPEPSNWRPSLKSIGITWFSSPSREIPGDLDRQLRV